MTTPFERGEMVRLTYAGHLVTIVELIGTDKARVRWSTAGKRDALAEAKCRTCTL